MATQTRFPLKDPRPLGGAVALRNPPQVPALVPRDAPHNPVNAEALDRMDAALADALEELRPGSSAGGSSPTASAAAPAAAAPVPTLAVIDG
eukprot:899089-Prymnesium_polylepis.1